MHSPGSYIVLTLLCCLTSGISLSEGNALFIGQLQVEDARTTTNNQLPLQYEIIHSAPAVLRQHLVTWFPHLISQSTGAIVKAANYPQAKNSVASEQFRATTFLIDYTEPSIQQLTVEIETAYGNSPTAQELKQFVFDYIRDKNAANGFDIASQVARSREGDCTEHAVLLTALLRMYDYPARVITGVYISLGEPSIGYGHAWTEYYYNNNWLGLDATHISTNVGPQHLPLTIVEDETIGYSVGLVKALQTMSIERIIVTN